MWEQALQALQTLHGGPCFEFAQSRAFVGRRECAHMPSWAGSQVF